MLDKFSAWNHIQFGECLFRSYGDSHKAFIHQTVSLLKTIDIVLNPPDEQ